MLWLQARPWGRWAAATLLMAVALWVDLRPDPSVDHAFAAVDIEAGTALQPGDLEVRRVPSGMLPEVDSAGTARVDIRAGEPLLPSNVGSGDQVVPSGWWAIEVELPQDAETGAAARVVLIDSGLQVEAMVISPPSADALGSGRGTLAIEPEHAAEAAAAAAEGRVAVMIAARQPLP